MTSLFASLVASLMLVNGNPVLSNEVSFWGKRVPVGYEEIKSKYIIFDWESDGLEDPIIGSRVIGLDGGILHLSTNTSKEGKTYWLQGKPIYFTFHKPDYLSKVFETGFIKEAIRGIKF